MSNDDFVTSFLNAANNAPDAKKVDEKAEIHRQEYEKKCALFNQMTEKSQGLSKEIEPLFKALKKLPPSLDGKKFFFDEKPAYVDEKSVSIRLAYMDEQAYHRLHGKNAPLNDFPMGAAIKFEITAIDKDTFETTFSYPGNSNKLGSYKISSVLGDWVGRQIPDADRRQRLGEILKEMFPPKKYPDVVVDHSKLNKFER